MATSLLLLSGSLDEIAAIFWPALGYTAIVLHLQLISTQASHVFLIYRVLRRGQMLLERILVIFAAVTDRSMHYRGCCCAATQHMALSLKTLSSCIQQSKLQRYPT